MQYSAESSFAMHLMRVSIEMLETHFESVAGRKHCIFCCRHTACTQTRLGQSPSSVCSPCSLYRCGTWCIVGTSCGDFWSAMPTPIEQLGTSSSPMYCCISDIPCGWTEPRMSCRGVCLGPWTDGRRSDACKPCTSRRSCSGCGKPFRDLSSNG